MKIAREARKTRVIRPATSNQLPQALQQQPRQRADQPSSQNRSQKSVQKSSNMKAGTPDQQKEPQTEPMNTKRALRPGTQYQISHSNAKPTPRSTKLEPQKQSEDTQKQKGKTQDTRPPSKSAEAYVKCTFLARSRNWYTHPARRRAQISRTLCSVASACFSRRLARAHLLLQVRLFSPRGRSRSREFSRTRGVHEQVR